MQRKTPFLLAAIAVALLSLGCDASITEGCIGGICQQGSGGGSTTGTGTGGSGGGGPPATGDYPCEVFAIIQEKCLPCHSEPPVNGAPFSLATYEDTQKPFGSAGRKRYQRMASVVSPDSGPYMPLLPNKVGVTALSEEQLALLLAFLDAPVPEAQGMGCECPGKDCK